MSFFPQRDIGIAERQHSYHIPSAAATALVAAEEPVPTDSLNDVQLLAQRYAKYVYIVGGTLSGGGPTTTVDGTGVDSSVIIDDIKLALKVETDSSNGTTYIAESLPGTPEASATWRVKRIVETVVGTVTTTKITWADGNSQFDNVASSLSTLTYS